MKIVGLIVIAATLLTVSPIAPANAGWCIEACGLKRVPRQQPRETVCTTVRRGNTVETVCTSK